MNATPKFALTIPMPKIGTIAAEEHLVVRVTWSYGIRAGRTDVVDLSPMISTYKLYRPLRENRGLFSAVHIIENGRVVAWGEKDEIDMPADAVERLAEETMTADDFRDYLKSNDLTHNEAAVLLGRSRRQIENYLSGSEPIPRIVVLACFGLTARKEQNREVKPTYYGSARMHVIDSASKGPATIGPNVVIKAHSTSSGIELETSRS